MIATRIRVSFCLLVFGVFAFGCSNSNTVTGPLAKATVTPIPTPTPIPGAVLSGFLTASRPSGLVPVNLATVSVQQGSRIFETTSNPHGFYEVVGLEAGVASVTATGTAPGGYYTVKGTATITLQLGFNGLNIQLNAIP